jgi:hypothetical protein
MNNNFLSLGMQSRKSSENLNEKPQKTKRSSIKLTIKTDQEHVPNKEREKLKNQVYKDEIEIIREQMLGYDNIPTTLSTPSSPDTKPVQKFNENSASFSLQKSPTEPPRKLSKSQNFEDEMESIDKTPKKKSRFQAILSFMAPKETKTNKHPFQADVEEESISETRKKLKEVYKDEFTFIKQQFTATSEEELNLTPKTEKTMETTQESKKPTPVSKQLFQESTSKPLEKIESQEDLSNKENEHSEDSSSEEKRKTKKLETFFSLFGKKKDKLEKLKPDEPGVTSTSKKPKIVFKDEMDFIREQIRIEEEHKALVRKAQEEEKKRKEMELEIKEKERKLKEFLSVEGEEIERKRIAKLKKLGGFTDEDLNQNTNQNKAKSQAQEELKQLQREIEKIEQERKKEMESIVESTIFIDSLNSHHEYLTLVQEEEEEVEEELTFIQIPETIEQKIHLKEEELKIETMYLEEQFIQETIIQEGMLEVENERNEEFQNRKQVEEIKRKAVQEEEEKLALERQLVEERIRIEEEEIQRKQDRIRNEELLKFEEQKKEKERIEMLKQEEEKRIKEINEKKEEEEEKLRLEQEMRLKAEEEEERLFTEKEERRIQEEIERQQAEDEKRRVQDEFQRHEERIQEELRKQEEKRIQQELEKQAEEKKLQEELRLHEEKNRLEEESRQRIAKQKEEEEKERIAQEKQSVEVQTEQNEKITDDNLNQEWIQDALSPREVDSPGRISEPSNSPGRVNENNSEEPKSKTINWIKDRKSKRVDDDWNKLDLKKTINNSSDIKSPTTAPEKKIEWLTPKLRKSASMIRTEKASEEESKPEWMKKKLGNTNAILSPKSPKTIGESKPEWMNVKLASTSKKPDLLK